MMIILMQEKNPSAPPNQFEFIENPTLNTITSMNSIYEKPPPSLKECRICLENHSSSMNELMQPCKCLGSVKYVHESCIKTWIEKLLTQKTEQEQEKFKTEGLQCEMCKFLIKFEASTEINCRACQIVKQQFVNKCWFVSLLIFVIAISLTGIGFMSWMIQTMTFTEQNNFLFILAIAGLILSSGFLVFGTFTFVSEIFLEKGIKVGKVFRKESHPTYQKHNKSKSQVIPSQEQPTNNSISIQLIRAQKKKKTQLRN